MKCSCIQCNLVIKSLIFHKAIEAKYKINVDTQQELSPLETHNLNEFTNKQMSSMYSTKETLPVSEFPGKHLLEL